MQPADEADRNSICYMNEGTSSIIQWRAPLRHSYKVTPGARSAIGNSNILKMLLPLGNLQNALVTSLVDKIDSY
jgi:hypothetical protein